MQYQWSSVPLSDLRPVRTMINGTWQTFAVHKSWYLGPWPRGYPSELTRSDHRAIAAAKQEAMR